MFPFSFLHTAFFCLTDGELCPRRGSGFANEAWRDYIRHRQTQQICCATCTLNVKVPTRLAHTRALQNKPRVVWSIWRLAPWLINNVAVLRYR